MEIFGRSSLSLSLFFSLRCCFFGPVVCSLSVFYLFIFFKDVLIIQYIYLFLI